MKRVFISLILLIFVGCKTTQQNSAVPLKFEVKENKKITATKVEEKEEQKENVKDSICFYFNKKQVGSMKVNEFKELLNAADNYKSLLDIEKNKNVKVELEENPWNIPVGKNFSTYVNIKWYDKNKEVKKDVRMQIEFEIPKEAGIGKIRSIYRDIAEWLTPLAIICAIIGFAI